jgi:hypothetical protein
MRILQIFECDDEVKKPRIFWFVVIGGLWMVWIVGLANDAYDKAAAELAANQSSGHVYSGVVNWWHSNDPDQARIEIIWRGILALIFVFIVAHYIAKAQAAFMQDVAARKRAAQGRREQREFANQIKDMDQASQQQASLSKLAQSKKELIVRLGNIDQFVRALEGERDSSSRTMALQDAHSQMTKLAANLASGEISRDALDDPEIREHALETSTDLTRIGLHHDRLNRDLVRIFKLNAE